MLNTAINIIKQAGEIVSSYYGKSEVNYKKGRDGRKDPYTEADIESLFRTACCAGLHRESI